MRAEIEAKIAQLEADLAAEKQKLQAMIETIPQEFHNLTRELFDKLKEFF